MIDPHVVALNYRVEHTDSIDYSDAKPLVVEDPGFLLTVEDERARFEMKTHFATEYEAREAVEECIRVWEFDANLKRGPDSFRLKFEPPAEIVDRNPTPGSVRISAELTAEGSGSSRLTIGAPEYPAPPTDITLDSDVMSMFLRYMDFRAGHATLPDVANFCFTILTYRASRNIDNLKRQKILKKNRIHNSVLGKIDFFVSRRGENIDSGKSDALLGKFSEDELTLLRESVKSISYHPNQKQMVSDEYRIERDVLQQIESLAANKGGKDARKSKGRSRDFTSEERLFLKRALKRIIRRVAEKAQAPDKDMEWIRMSDLMNDNNRFGL